MSQSVNAPDVVHHWETMTPVPPPALIATARGALWLSADGAIERIAAPETALRSSHAAPLVVHAPAVAARLGLDNLPARDLLELYAFVHPATFCLPTVRGVAAAVDVHVGPTPEDELAALPQIAQALIGSLEDMAPLASPEFKDIALTMARGDWAWGDTVLLALDVNPPIGKKPRPGAGLDIWKSLAQWEEPPPATRPAANPSSRARRACV